MGKIILLLVLMIGIISGGPKQVAPIDEDHVVGSIPVLVETCNATAIETVTCDRGCLQQDYNILRTELPGTLLRDYPESELDCKPSRVRYLRHS